MMREFLWVSDYTLDILTPIYTLCEKHRIAVIETPEINKEGLRKVIIEGEPENVQAYIKEVIEMGKTQKIGLFFPFEGVPHEAWEIARRYGVETDGELCKIKKDGWERCVEELFLNGEEEAVEKAWEEISQLPECINSKVFQFKG